MKQVKITEVCDIQVGKTPSRSNPSYWGDGSLWLSIADMNQGSILEFTKETITPKAVKECNCRIVPQNTVLFSFKLSIGKVGITKVPMYTNEAIAAFIIKDLSKLDPRFLLYVLKSVDHSIGSNKAVMGKTLNKEQLKKIEIPQLPIEDQKRIVKILDQADNIRRKRREAISLLGDYLKSVFLEMFGDLRINNYDWKLVNLGDISDIVSGVTKGQKYNGKKLIEVPYLRVANVQEGYLDLSEIKTISTTSLNIDKLRLKVGDILMTEGGDYDKLGRGAIWHGEIPDCIHQNHIFRVRLNPSRINPEFFSALLLTPFAKEYFLRASKKTTNLATINMTQLKALPVPLVTIALQNKFAKMVIDTENLKRKMLTQEGQLENQFQSMMQKYFSAN